MSSRAPIAAAGAAVVAIVLVGILIAFESFAPPQRDGMRRLPPGEARVATGEARRELVADLEPAPGSFASHDADGRRRADAVPDGLTIVVRDEAGSPRVDAMVKASWQRPTDDGWTSGSDHGATDARDRLRTSIRDAAHFEKVAVMTVEFGWLAFEGVFQSQGASRGEVVFVVPAAAQLDVLVVDTAGTPLPGAEVGVRSEVVGGAPRTHRLATEEDVVAPADAHGLARLRVPAGRNVVGAHTESHASFHTLHCDLPAGPCSLRVVLAATATRPVPVHVVLPPGVASEVDVRCETSELHTMPPQPLVARVDASRRWLRWERVGPVDFVVQAPAVKWYLGLAAEGCREHGEWIEATQPQVTVVLSRLPEQPARVRGRVVDANGTPVAAEVVVYEAWDDVGRDVERTDDDGHFVIRRGSRQPVCLRAQNRAGVSAVAGPIAWAADPVDVELVLASGVVRGRLGDANGAPLAGTVRLLRPAGGLAGLGPGAPARVGLRGAHDLVWTDEAGRFQFTAVGAGDHELHADVGGADWPARQLVRAGDVVELRCGAGLAELALVEVVVVDADTSEPLPGVSCRPTGISDAQGRMRLAVAPGDAELEFWAAGRVHRHVACRGLVAGVQRRIVALPRGVSRFVRLVDGAGRPCDDAEIRVHDDAPTPERAFRRLLDAHGGCEGMDVATDGNGRADLHGLPAGSLRLSVERRAWNSMGLRSGDSVVREFVLGPDDGVATVAELRW